MSIIDTMKKKYELTNSDNLDKASRSLMTQRSALELKRNEMNLEIQKNEAFIGEINLEIEIIQYIAESRDCS